MSIQRYDLFGYDADVEPRQNGRFVEYDGHIAEMQRLRALLEKTMGMVTWHTVDPDVVRHINACLDAIKMHKPKDQLAGHPAPMNPVVGPLSDTEK